MEEKNITPLSPEENTSIWNNVFAQIRMKERKRRRRKRSLFATAAILLIFATFWTYNSLFKPDTYIAIDETREIRLADGTTVTILKGAKLTVEKSFPADTREVFLEGNAIFQVAKSKSHPFIVHSNGYETKVLGTVFKVSQNGRTFKVDLFEGKVLVYRKGHAKEPTVLKPQQTFSNLGIPEVASVTKNITTKSATADAKPTILTFNECPIGDAVKIIQKEFGVKIHYPGELENEKISVSLPTASAEAFLQSLAVQFNLNIKQTNDSTFELEN